MKECLSSVCYEMFQPMLEARERGETIENRQGLIHGCTLLVKGIINDYFQLEGDKRLEVEVLVNEAKGRLM